MNAPGAKSTLEVVTNVAILLAATAFLTALSWGFFVQQRAPSTTGGFRKGEEAAVLPNVDYAGAPKTLVVVLNTRCRFCAESVPFYNSLAAGRAGTRVIAVFPNDEGEVREYARQQSLKLETVAGADLRTLHTESTPTMILVGRDGKILDFWIGKLSAASEALVTTVVAPS